MSDTDDRERGPTATETAAYWRESYQEALKRRAELSGRLQDPALPAAERAGLQAQLEEVGGEIPGLSATSASVGGLTPAHA